MISRFEEDWGKFLGRIRFYRQSLTKYVGKSKKIKQNWKRPEKCDMSFCVNLIRKDWTLVSQLV